MYGEVLRELLVKSREFQRDDRREKARFHVIKDPQSFGVVKWWGLPDTCFDWTRC